MDTVILFTAKDTGDIQHTNLGALKIIDYNAYDNLVYYVDYTNAAFQPPSNCFPSYGNNYVQVIAMDTNLNTRWRKFIYPGANMCAQITYMTACNNRSGVLVGGTLKDLHLPSLPIAQPNFLYRVDSSISTNGVSNPNGLIIRDRFAVYPNPAKDHIIVDDFLGKLAEVSITNMQGQVIYHNTASGNKQQVSVAQYPAGLYMVRCRSTDDEWYSTKILKE